MSFNSLEYIAFLIAVIICYFLIPQRYRWILLLVANYYFYMSWKAEFALLIVISTLVDFYCARSIYQASSQQIKKRLLASSLIVNLWILAFYKYANFITDNVQELIDVFTIDIALPYAHIILPIGISFYTFQTISYTIDVYRGQIKPETHIWIFATYISFFPQLVAWPIERASNLLYQFRERHYFSYTNLWSGIKLMIRWFFKKVVIADRVALLITPLFANPQEYGSSAIILATFLFGVQIYCDFSWYTDIARGTAKILWFNLMHNFKRPYFAKSIAWFWRRWHISLSTRFRDYIYIPLWWNRVSHLVWTRNILITFLISWLRHGAAWTFVIRWWLHGFFIICEKYINKLLIFQRESTRITLFKVLCTFFLVQILWLFFRAESFWDILYVFRNIWQWSIIPVQRISLGPIWAEFRILIIFMVLLVLVETQQELTMIFNKQKKGDDEHYNIIFYALLTLVVILFLVKGPQDFIYFQF